jgi:hypothetical protein
MERRTYQPRAKTVEQLGVHPITIARWEDDPRTGFPQPRRVNGRKYDDVAELHAWLARRDEVAA